MKTREEAAAFILNQLYGLDYKCSRSKGVIHCEAHHYGKQNLRELMDFIYGGAPENSRQNIGEDEQPLKYKYGQMVSALAALDTNTGG